MTALTAVLHLTGLTGCTSLGSASAPPELRSVRLPAALTAWAAADVCRGHFASADPLPQHAGAPVTALDDGRFEIQVGRTADGPFRFAMSGRLLPPATRVDGDDVRPDGVRYLPGVGDPTTTRGTTDSVRIVVAPDGAGSRVFVEVSGSLEDSPLVEHVARVVHVLELSHTQDDRVTRGATRENLQAADARLREIASSCCARHQILLAPLFARLATAHERLGDLAGARIALNGAVDRDPTCHALRARLARMDDRTARSDDAERNWLHLAHSPGVGILGRVLQGRLCARLPFDSGNSTGFLATENGRRLLGQDDVPGALAWSVRRADQTAREPMQLWTLLHRVRGDHLSAFVTGVEQLESHGFDAALVLALNRDSIGFGDPAAGLRLMAHHWPKLEAAAPEEARRAMRQAIAATGRALACRILVSEDCGGPGAEQVARWSREAGADGTGAELLSRVSDLRRTAARGTEAAARELPERPFDHAPGVAPMR